ncbi:hypothetical protein KIL84_004350 [Mauremys mutica]|uniref:Uncharacterized protein n=1 Tax=Mauremys mutica TaxID=74926 RepID=A0A9D3XP72_9SAUR|nr:hypothetical protein KIL84_004350 [Mauremys mutica]
MHRWGTAAQRDLATLGTNPSSPEPAPWCLHSGQSSLPSMQFTQEGKNTCKTKGYWGCSTVPKLIVTSPHASFPFRDPPHTPSLPPTLEHVAVRGRAGFSSGKLL